VSLGLRLVKEGAAIINRRKSTHTRVVTIVGEATANFDDAHLAYLIERGIIVWKLLPFRFTAVALNWLLPNADLMDLPSEALVAAAIEARPAIAPLLQTERGRLWLRNFFSWR